MPHLGDPTISPSTQDCNVYSPTTHSSVTTDQILAQSHALKDKNPRAETLLRLLCCLSNQGESIPEFILLGPFSMSLYDWDEKGERRTCHISGIQSYMTMFSTKEVVVSGLQFLKRLGIIHSTKSNSFNCLSVDKGVWRDNISFEGSNKWAIIALNLVTGLFPRHYLLEPL